VELKNRPQKVVLITSGQPALNPRLVKEADSLAAANYEVTVIYAYWNDWGDEFNKKLLLTKKWKSVCAGGHPVENPFVYFTSKFIYRLAKWGFTKWKLNLLAEIAVARAAWFLTQQAKKHEADLYIGHNLGALPATVKAARKYKAKCGFDCEDFHRQEISDDINSGPYKTAKCLEDKYFKELDYLTTSSPQITAAYEQLYPYKKPLTILNVFPKSIPTQQRPFNSCGPVKLFWFSQTLGTNRGLDEIAKALKYLDSPDFELHLLGYMPENKQKEFTDEMLSGIDNVFFHQPIPPDELIDFAVQFDIGLAVENKTPVNRDICLTNKLFTYLEAGLAIIASNTTAQSGFLNENPRVGKIYQRENIQSLVDILSGYHSDRKLLYETGEAALKLGREELNWENERGKFLGLVADTLRKIE
jgi:glycosyltransferase involved in cell wall biosynthesis